MPYVKKFGLKLPGGLDPDKFDPFHEMIIHMEMHRFLCPGYENGLNTGCIIGLPPVIHFWGKGRKTAAPEGKQDQVIRECLTGEKRICL